MLTELKKKIRAALAGSTAQKPVETYSIVKGHQRGRVEAALMELYQAREVYCCKIIKGGRESVVWWLSGVVEQTFYYGRKNYPQNNHSGVSV